MPQIANTPNTGRRLALHPADFGIVALGVLLVTWLPDHWNQVPWARSFDSAAFALVGPLLAWLQWQLAARLPLAAERRAWRLLAGASLARSTSGLVWGQWALTHVDVAEPAWLLALKWTYLVFTIAALSTFPSARFRPTDRLRYRLDLAMAVGGGAIVAWFFALGPFFDTRSLSVDFLDDFVHALGDSVVVVLAAALHLRAATAVTRRVALWLAAASIWQVVPDIWFWSTSNLTRGRALDWISLVWFCVWLLKWLGVWSARAMLGGPALQETSSSAAAPDDTQGAELPRSPLPAAFLITATALQLVALLSSTNHDGTTLAIGSLSLALLLVARQAVELREYDRLQVALADDAARQRALLNRAYDAIVILDRDGRLEYASPSVELLAKALSDRHKPWSLLERIHPDDHRHVREAIATASRAPVPLSIRLQDRYDEWRVFEGYLQDFRGDPLIDGFVLNGIDRTRELQLEQGLRDAQQFEALGVMASGLAHDLGNTLTVVASHVELLHDDPAMSPRALVDLAAVRSASDRARALTAGLLALSRRKSANTTLVAVDEVVRERLAAQTRRTPPVVAPEARGPLVRVNRAALAQLVDAVIDEAHAERGTASIPLVTLDVRDVPSTVAAALHIDGGRYLVIGVGDAIDAASADVQSVVRTHDQGEWDLSPSDLAMLMALAAARELGGTVSRERTSEAQRFAIYVPAVAA